MTESDKELFEIARSLSAIEATQKQILERTERIEKKVDDHEKKIYSNVGFTSFITIILSSIVTFGISFFTKHHN